MPFRLSLTWMPHANRWRKRYLGRTYYLKTKSNGRRDRDGYLAALAEWERLKAFLDGLGPNPYTATGTLIPETQAGDTAPLYFPPMLSREVATATLTRPAIIGSNRVADNPLWIQSVGIGEFLHPEQLIAEPIGNSHTEEHRISVLADRWLNLRQKQAERGDLSLTQWSEDRAKLQTFRDFLSVNFPEVIYIEQISATILNEYREKQTEFLDCKGEHRISKVTLRKRLTTLVRWLDWLVDQNYLTQLPKDLRKYGRVKLDSPKPVFFTIDEIKTLSSIASERTRLYIMLGLNLGYCQRDISTLEPEMIDWQSGIVTRNRKKTGVASQAKLWPSTLALLKKHRSPKKSGPVLLNQKGTPLHSERINANGKLVANCAIRLSFDRALKHSKITGRKRGFKHLRKTGADQIEQIDSDLTSLYLSHGERKTKRHYVVAHYEALFAATDRLESLFSFSG